MKKLLKITIVAVLALGLILIGAGLIISKGNIGGVFAKESRTESRIDETETVTSLKLSVDSDNIELYPSEDGKLHIEYWNSDKRPYLYDFSDGVAELKQQSSIQSWFDFTRHTIKTVKVFAPESITDTLSIKLSSGSLQSKGYAPSVQSLNIQISSGDAVMAQCSAENALVKVASGSIAFTEINVENIDINISSGNFALSHSQISGKLDIDMASGDANITNCEIGILKSDISSGTINAKSVTASSVNCRAASGDIVLRLNGAASDYSVDIDLSSGQALLDIAGQTMKADKGLEWGNGAKKIYCKSASGSVKIYFAN